MAAKPLVHMSRSIPPDCQGLQMLLEKCRVTVYDGNSGMIEPRDSLLKHVSGAAGIFIMPPERIDTELLDMAGPQLKVVGTMSVGLEHIYLKESAKRNIKVGYTPDVLSDAVAEGTLAMTLATSCRYEGGLAAASNGEWGKTWNNSLYLCGKDLKGSVVGIVGLGRIGLAVAKRLKAFEVASILYSGNTPKDYASEIQAEFVPLNDLLSRSDFVIACCSVNPSNVGMFNADAFKRMNNSAILINTSRGALVNQDDLYVALTTGQILAAGLDVTNPEPLPLDSHLLTLKNCTIVPHLGSASVKVRYEMADLTARNIIAGLNDEPLISPVPAQ